MSQIFLGSFSLYQLFIYFFLYSFLGWCSEVIFATLKTGKFVNRGFLNGPVCPIYGTGVVLLLLCLMPLKKYPWAVFFVSVILCSALEFLTGFVLEKIFHKNGGITQTGNSTSADLFVPKCPCSGALPPSPFFTAFSRRLPHCSDASLSLQGTLFSGSAPQLL